MAENETECFDRIIPTTKPKPIVVNCDKCGNEMTLTDDERYYCNYCKQFFEKK